MSNTCDTVATQPISLNLDAAILNLSSHAWNERHGFWNAAGSQGEWRVVPVCRYGSSPGPDGEQASVLSWPNATAQNLARTMLGFEGPGELPNIFDASLCSRLLSLQVAVSCAKAAGINVAEAPYWLADHREAESSFTCRMIIFQKTDMCLMAAGLQLIASSSGGQVRHSHIELEQQARKLIEPLEPSILFDPRTGACRRDGVEPEDTFWLCDAQGCDHVFDARAFAHEISGLPWNILSQEPSTRIGPRTFLNKVALVNMASHLGEAVFSLGCSARFDPAIDTVNSSFGLDQLNAAQQARVLHAEIVPALKKRSTPSL